MSRSDDTKGYLQIDPAGRAIILGSNLRAELAQHEGYYTFLPSDGALLHFQRATKHPRHEEFREPLILHGDIEAMGSTIEVINFVHSAQLTGNLVFVAGDVRKSIYFKKGEVRGASSNQLEDRLGEVMCRLGGLTREQLAQATEECRRRRRPLGNYLLEKEVINQADLYVYVRRQVEEVFYSVLLVRDGDFYLTKFDSKRLPSPLSLNAQSLLMEGLRRIDEMSLFRKQIPRADSCVGRTRKDPEGVELQPKEELVLSSLAQPTTVDELVRICRMGEFEATKVLFNLIQGGYVQVVEEHQGGPEVSAEQVSAEMASMVETFNSVFERIYRAISRHGRQDALEQGLETFLQFYGFVELFQGVTFDDQGRLDQGTLLENLCENQIDNRVSFLSQALNELLFFEMFAAREWLERDEQQDLQRIINQLFIDIG